MSVSAELKFASILKEIDRTLGSDDCSIKDFELDVREDWRARAGNGHRLAIRTELARRFREPALMDLSLLPDPAHQSLSISHCPIAGGYALCSGPHSIGFDLEVASRIRPATVARIASPDELQASPSPAFLWAAKEATFKALRGENQPSVVSELGILDWQAVPEVAVAGTRSQPWTFKSNLTNGNRMVFGKGLVFQLGDLIYAIFAALGST